MNTQSKGLQYSLVIHAAVILTVLGLSTLVDRRQPVVIDFNLEPPGHAASKVDPAAPSPNQKVQKVLSKKLPSPARNEKIQAKPQPVVREDVKPVPPFETPKAPDPSLAGIHSTSDLIVPVDQPGDPYVAGGLGKQGDPTVPGARLEGKSQEAHSAIRGKPGNKTVSSEAGPLYRDNPPPAYPVLARKRGYEGMVILKVFVSRNGRVADLKIHQSSGYAVLDEAALATVKGWQFQPGKRGETAIDMWVRVPIRFTLTGTNAEISQRSREEEGAGRKLF